MEALIDLRAKLGGVRDQGQRLTCLAFALSAGHRCARGNNVECSPEFLHREAARLSGREIERAVPTSSAIQALRDTGQPSEADWPYGSAFATVNPLTTAKAVSMSEQVASSKAWETLSDGRPVLLILRIGLEFYTAKPGTVLSSPAGDRAEIRHAVLAIAARAQPQGKQFLLRNSWGLAWGDAGNIWATAAYIDATGELAVKLEAKL